MRWSGATDPGEEAQAASRGSVPGPGEWVRSAAVLGLAAAGAAAAWACARPSSPPGAKEESEPPGVRSVFPARDTVLEQLGRPAKIQFDEPIQGGSGLGRQLVASPAYRYTVTVGHSEISIRPEGGWRSGAVYVLELPSGISDLLNNAREEPIRMVFSTGPPIRPTLVRAQIFDRITGQPQQGGRMLVLSAREDTAPAARDTVPYTAVADSAGIYSRRHIPPGSYWAYGFVDRNRNLRLDRRLEPYDSVRVELESDSAEASLNFFTLPPDSTPPRLGRVRTPDSVTIRLEFDDHLRPGQRPGGFRVYPAGGGEGIPASEIRVLTAEDTARAAREGAPADTAAADTVPSDSVAADSLPPDSLRADSIVGDSVTPDSLPGETVGRADTAVRDTAAADSLAADTAAADTVSPDSAAADTMKVDKPPRPTRVLEIRLERPMRPDTFRIQMQRVRNMWGLTTDVDTTFGYEPPPDSLRSDTAAAVGDTAVADSVPPDSATADTAGAAPDTVASGSLPSDSLRADTLPPDTTGAGEP